MITVIISGHGNFPIALKESSGMIFGEEESLIAVPFLKGEGIQTLQEKYHQTLKDVPEEHEVLFLVDIFGGTPYNAPTPYIAKERRFDMAAGVNLPILLEALSLREHILAQTTAEPVEKDEPGMLPNMRRAIGKIQSVQSGKRG